MCIPLSTNSLCWYSAMPSFILNDLIFLLNNKKNGKYKYLLFCVLKSRLIGNNCLILLWIVEERQLVDKWLEGCFCKNYVRKPCVKGIAV